MTDQTTSMPDRSSPQTALKVLVGGMLGMVIAMGIGRFAFTPILPLMQRDLGMSNALAGWLAGLNYLGYLAGAVLFSFYPALLRNRLLTAAALVASLATTLLMGVTESAFWWGTMRLFGGLASAVLFIVISAEVGETLGRHGQGQRIGALYAGIGLGIALSGLIVPHLDSFGGWDTAWIGMGLLAILLAFTSLYLGRNRERTQPHEAPQAAGRELASIRLLFIAYFFQGLGYIVTATFIVAIIAVTPGLERVAPYSWVAVGLAAIPSTILWPYMAARFGRRQAMLAAYLIQAAGIVVSVWATGIGEVLFAALSFGGTMLGIVTMTLAEGSRRMPNNSRRAAAVLTMAFGIGQMLGPVFAGLLADQHQGFTLPLALAAACVFTGALFTAIDTRFSIT